MTRTEPEFVGESRHGLVLGLLALFDQVNQSPQPRWVSLEAPSGWGKTRVAREFYAALAARQPDPAYWPATILAPDEAGVDVSTRRKRVNPSVRHVPGSLPGFTWWGITCSMRHGLATVALAQDAGTLQAHAPYLEDAWRKLPRTSLAAQDARAFGVALLDEGAMELGGRVVETVVGTAVPGLGLVRCLGEWSWDKLKDGRQRRERLRSTDEVGPDHSDLADSLAELLTRLSRPGLATVVFVEDLHDADPLLVDLLGSLVESRSSILLVTTAWPGHVDEDERLAAAMARAGGRLVRVTPEAERLPDPFGPAAGLGPLEPGALDAMLRFHYPHVTAQTAARIVERYPNPLALELFCQIPGLRRRFTDRELDLSERDLERLPNSIRDLYRQLWRELPASLRQALALATLGIPDVLAPEAGRSPWWNAELVAEAIAVLQLPEADEVDAALRGAPTAYAWARVVSQTLRQFVEPDQLAVAADELDEFVMPWESDEIKQALAVRARDRLTGAGLTSAERVHGAYLLLALHAEGFVADPASVVLAVATLLEELREAPRELAERLRLGRLALALTTPVSARVLNVRRDFGQALAEAEQSQEAITVLAGLRAQRLELTGVEDEDSVRDGFHHAAALSNDDPDAAQRLLEELTVSAIDALGSRHRETLRLRHLQAVVTADLGRLTEALRINSEVVDQRRQVLGPQHRETLQTAGNVAVNLRDLGRYAEALDMALDVLSQRRSALGVAHRDTLLGQQNVAELHELLGDLDQATSLRRQLFADKRELLGPDHPDTLWAAQEYASSLAAAGWGDQALLVQDDVVERYQRLSPDSQPALMARSSQADLVQGDGRPRDALAMHEQVLADTATIFGAQHVNTLWRRNAWLWAMSGLVRPATQISGFESLRRDAAAALGEQNTLTQQATRNQCSLLLDDARPEQALALAEQLWHQPGRPDLPYPTQARNLLTLVDILNVLGREAEAIELLDAEAPRIVAALGRQGDLSIRLEWARATALCADDPVAASADLRRLITRLGDHGRTELHADLRAALAWATQRTGDLSGALQQHQELVADRLALLGPAHPEVTRRLSTMLDVASQAHAFTPELVDLCATIIEGARTTLGPQSPRFIRLLTMTSLIAMGEDHDDRTLAWRQELVDLLAADPDTDDAQMAEARTHLGYGLLMNAQYDDSLEQLTTSARLLHLTLPTEALAVMTTRLAVIASRAVERHDLAIELLQQQIQLLEAHLPDSADLAGLREELAELRGADGSPIP